MYNMKSHTLQELANRPARTRLFKLDTGGAGGDDILYGSNREDVLLDVLHFHELSVLPVDWELLELTSAESFPLDLGFEDMDDVLEASHPHHDEGDTTFYVTQLPDGRWAAWDDYELAIDRVEFFATRKEAESALDEIQAMDRQ